MSKKQSRFAAIGRKNLSCEFMASYKDAGVDIDAGNEAAQRIKGYVKKTHHRAVISGAGLFGGAISLKKFKKFKDPVLVSTIDGVGTKLMVARMLGKWDSVGKDLVNHSSNDILCLGAEPLFFLDYVASSKLEPAIVEEIVKGMGEACKEVGCSLIGGETAEMSGVYEEGEYDLVGCMVGVAESKDLLDGSKIKPGDELIALQSSGLHTNGYSLARRVIFNMAGLGVNDFVKELGCTVGEELLKVHKSYSKPVLALRKKFDIRGIAHITGGGLIDNIPRILSKGLGAELKESLIKPLPIFKLIQEKGDVTNEEMYRTFNMGVGLVIAVPKKQTEKIIKALKKSKENAYFIGKVVRGEGVRFK